MIAGALLFLGTGVHADSETPEEDAWKSKHVFFGFSQIGVKFGDGAKLGDEASLGFEADRIRLGWKYYSGPLAAKVFLDFAKDGTDNGGVGVPDMIKDAFIAYNFDDSAVLKAGVIKTPVGMGFTIPGWNLDVIKRGFDKKLAFERAFGLMVSGRDIGFGNDGKVDGLEMGHERPWKGFGYDIMVSGATGRSGAVNTPTDVTTDSTGKVTTKITPNQSNAYMGRVMFDWGEAIHTEASYGISKNADGDNNENTGEDYKVLNFGIDSHLGETNLKAEYYNVENIRGVDGWDMNTLALTATYFLTDTVEVAVKDIRGTSSAKSASDGKASNTYLGVNYYINPKNDKMDRKSKRGRNQHRVQINYVVADVDSNFNDVGSLYKDDAVLAQYQFKF